MRRLPKRLDIEEQLADYVKEPELHPLQEWYGWGLSALARKRQQEDIAWLDWRGY